MTDHIDKAPHRPTLGRLDGRESLEQMITIIAEGDEDAFGILQDWADTAPNPFIAGNEISFLDYKRLYGHRIVKLYDACGDDINRLQYHALVELPEQTTGKLYATGPMAPDFGDTEEHKAFWEKRQFGEPGSFWALQDPPTDPNYEFPIK